MDSTDTSETFIRRRRKIESEDVVERVGESVDDDDKYAKYERRKWYLKYWRTSIDWIAYPVVYLKAFMFWLTRHKSFEAPEKIIDDLLQNLAFEELKTLTPEELLTQKLANNEFAEALELAKKYSLDKDLVYQRVWRYTPITRQTIDEYLARISKDLWILRECVECVATSADDMRYLLQFGLQLTQSLITGFQTRKSVGEVENRVIDEEEEEKAEESNDTSDPFIDVNRLTIEEKQIFMWRKRLLHYSDRLSIYELIIRQSVDDGYDSKFFESFRNMSPFEAAIYFARHSNSTATSVLFTYEGENTLENRLAILSNFPETVSPKIYSPLLPLLRRPKEKAPEVCNWLTSQSSEPDWCEKFFDQLNISLVNTQYETDFYIDNPNLLKYKMKSLTKAIVSQWFNERARDIMNLTALVSNALELIELGISNNVPALDKLHHELDVYALLVYESNCTTAIDFDSFEKLNNNEKLDLIMSEAIKSEEQFLLYIEKFLNKFLDKVCKDYEKLRQTVGRNLFHDYLVSIARTDLKLCLKVFEKSSLGDIKIDELSKSKKIIQDPCDLIEFALDCVYACDDCSQLDQCFKIVECLPQRESVKILANSDPIREKRLNELSDLADRLEKHLVVSEMIEQYDTPPTLSAIKNFESQSDRDGVKLLLTKVSRNCAKSAQSMTVNQWIDFLNCMLEVRQLCFSDCITEDELFEVFVQTLLCSAKKENFNLAATYMQLNSDAKLKKKVISFSKSKKLILSAAQEYIDSSNSAQDSNILLAIDCLHLIDENEQRRDALIADELDFIEALHLIDDNFPLKLLPIQIRLIPQPRIEIIEKILKSTSKAYTKTSKILNISKLLKVCNDCNNKVVSVDDYREGTVLSMISNLALKLNDYKHAFNTCKLIMKNNYTVGWKVCLDLGMRNEYDNVEDRLELLCFALTYCDENEDQRLLQLIDIVRQLKIEHNITLSRI